MKAPSPIVIQLHYNHNSFYSKLLTRCLSGPSYKIADLGRVFAAGSGFHARDYVNAPGTKCGDGFGYVLWAQSAGGDNAVIARLSRLEESLGSESPVE